MKNFMNEKVLPVITAISSHHYVKAIQSGMMALVGITIFGGIATILKQPPIPADTTNAFGLALLNFASANQSWLEIIYQTSTNLIGLLSLIGIVTSLCKHYHKEPLNFIATSLVCYIIISVNLVEFTGAYGKGFHFDITYFGAQGIFTAIITAIVVVELTRFIEAHNIKIKMPDSVPPFVAQPFEALISNFIVLSVFILIRVICGSFGFMFPQLIMVILYPLMSASESFWAVVFLFAFSRVLWFFGIHGTGIIMSVLVPIMVTNHIANLEAYNAGLAIPHILTMNLMTYQIGMLPAAIAMLLVCKSAQLKATAKLGIVPSVFMISEPILFGTPFVFNPTLFIPHIAAFAWSIGAAYLAFDWGIVAKPIFSTIGNLPGFIAAYLQAFDWKAVVLWFVIVIVDVLIYMPFLKKYDNQLLEEENKAVEA